MVAALNLSGSTFGDLVVVRRNGSQRYVKNGKARCSFAMWECICSCGAIVSVNSRSLVGGRTKSCGCRRRKKKREEGTTVLRLFSVYKQNAKRRGIPWSLTIQQFEHIVSSPCYFTGRVPQATMQYRRGELLLWNGIDRLDASGGYTPENCVACCSEVNRAKSDLSEDAFLALVSEIASHRLRQVLNVKG